MLHNTSIDLAVNLAVIARQSGVKLTPVASTLMATLCANVRNGISLDQLREAPLAASPDGIYDYSALKSAIQRGAEGQKIPGNRHVVASYAESAHDTLMDNYIKEYATLVSTHILFARSVVYRDMQTFVDKLQSSVSGIRMKNAEDLFNVVYVRKHDVFNSSVIENEVYPYRDHTCTNSKFGFRESIFTPEFDLLDSLLTGETGQDELIKNWYASVGGEKLLSYMRVVDSDSFILRLSSIAEQMNFYLVNFLFFRKLALQPDLSVGLSVTALTGLAVALRNANACWLLSAMDQYNNYVKSNMLMFPLSSGSLSFLPENGGIEVRIIEEVFERATAEGLTLEHIFGFIADRGQEPPTLDTIKNSGDSYLEVWRRQRGLFSVYTSERRQSMLKDAILHTYREVLSSPEHMESMAEYYGQNTQAVNESVRQGEAYLAGLTFEEMENSLSVALHLVARIAYRHSNAYDIIKGMLEVMARDPETEPTRAVTVSITRYLTKYLMSQLVRT